MILSRSSSTIRSKYDEICIRCAIAVKKTSMKSLQPTQTKSDGASLPSRARPRAKRGAVTSTDWTRALLGTDVIQLQGFAGPAVSVSGVPWIKIGGDEGGTLLPSSTATRVRMRTMVVLVLSTVVASFVLGCLWQLQSADSASVARQSASLPSWRVVGVQADGVTISIDGATRRELRIPVGRALPNGEQLLQTDVERRIYRTASASVLVREVGPQTTRTP